MNFMIAINSAVQLIESMQMNSVVESGRPHGRRLHSHYKHEGAELKPVQNGSRSHSKLRRRRNGLSAIRGQVVLGGAVVLLMTGCSREQAEGVRSERSPMGSFASTFTPLAGDTLQEGSAAADRSEVHKVKTADGMNISLARGARAKVVPERAGSFSSKGLTLREMHPEKVLQSFPIPVSTAK